MRPADGPFLFDARAESYLASGRDPAAAKWLRKYLELFAPRISALTVMARLRGYALLMEREDFRREALGSRRDAYLENIAAGRLEVLPVSPEAALLAAQLTVLMPFALNPPYRAGAAAESRPERLSRWRADLLLAATALAEGLPLVHDNPGDFEPVRALVERFPERFPDVAPLRLAWVRKLTA